MGTRGVGTHPLFLFRGGHQLFSFFDQATHNEACLAGSEIAVVVVISVTLNAVGETKFFGYFVFDLIGNDTTSGHSSTSHR